MKYLLFAFIFFVYSVSAQNSSILKSDSCSILNNYAEILALQESPLRIENFKDLTLLYKASLGSLCDEWQQIKILQSFNNCFVNSQKNKGCNIVTAKMVDYFGSHIVKDGKIENVPFGKGYNTEVIYFIDSKVSIKNKFEFFNHIAASIKLKNDSIYVLDRVISDELPTSKALFKQLYLKLNKKITFYESKISLYENCLSLPISSGSRSIQINSVFNENDNDEILLKLPIQKLENYLQEKLKIVTKPKLIKPKK